MNQLKESGKEFNICQLKLKSSTTQKETTTLLDNPNTSALDTNKEPPTFHPKVELEPKLSTKLDMLQFQDQLSKDNQSLDKEPLNMSLAHNTPLNIALAQFIPLDKPTPPVKLTLLEVVELEEKTSTDNPKLKDMSLEAVESDNNDFFV